jgi:predicted transcriptional regulator
MLDLQTQRKVKIVLSDYDYRRDLENRLLMSQFNDRDVHVLHEVLYSPLRFSLRKMARSLDLKETELENILKNLGKTGLLSIDGDNVDVDKEMRKYFETQVLKFEEDFKPGMEYLAGLLRKVPIHILPAWYAVPRTSNNIFESIIERYLATPQIYYRYVQDFSSTHPSLSSLVKDLFSSSELKLSGQTVIERYRMTREQFEETTLLLEFSLIACLRYEKVGDEWKEMITPFDEWREHLAFLRNTQAQPILDEEKVKPFRSQDFSFVRDLTTVLQLAKTKPISLSPSKSVTAAISKRLDLDLEEEKNKAYFSKLFTKLHLLKLGEIVDGELRAHGNADSWLKFSDQDKAIFLYRHTGNKLLSEHLPDPLPIDKAVREAEKCILRVLHAGWVEIDEVIEGSLIGLSEEPILVLKKAGRLWKYTRPQYTDEQKNMLRAVLQDWLFEIGAVSVAIYKKTTCLKVTDFGHTLFGN